MNRVSASGEFYMAQHAKHDVTALLFDKHFTHALELYTACTSLDVELFFASLYDLHFCECIGSS